MQASKLESLLTRHKAAIADRWFTHILESYPSDAARFFRTESDRIANPVGQTLASALERLVEELGQGFEDERLRPHVEAIVRIRAVQDFAPSRALAFVFFLKEAMRDALRHEEKDEALERAMSRFERSVDSLSLLAFDCYLSCKVKMYEIRVDEMKRRTAKLLERFCDPPLGDGEEPQ